MSVGERGSGKKTDGPPSFTVHPWAPAAAVGSGTVPALFHRGIITISTFRVGFLIQFSIGSGKVYLGTDFGQNIRFKLLVTSK